MDAKGFEVIAVIAARKAEFYENAKRQLLKSLPTYVDRDKARRRLRKVIASLDNELFVSADEKATRVVRPERSVRDLTLDRRAIAAQVLAAMTSLP